MYNGLLKAQTHLKKYNTFHLIYCKTKQPEGILNGFINFCKINNYTHTVSKNLENNTPKKGHLYVVLNDKDLITIIKQTQQHQLKIAKDIGIISFNDHLLKEVVQGGITTISTDFKLMGQQLANLILNNTHTKIENPSTLISRNSI
jgi:Transcriptional regulators